MIRLSRTQMILVAVGIAAVIYVAFTLGIDKAMHPHSPPQSEAAAEATRIGELVISGPWARASVGSSRPAVAYFTIGNEGAEADALIGVATSVAATAGVHATRTNDRGVTSMAPAGQIEIPPGASVSLAPGGLHVMLMKLTEPLVEGETILLTLTFAKAGQVEVVVPILEISALGPTE